MGVRIEQLEKQEVEMRTFVFRGQCARISEYGASWVRTYASCIGDSQWIACVVRALRIQYTHHARLVRTFVCIACLLRGDWQWGRRRIGALIEANMLFLCEIRICQCFKSIFYTSNSSFAF